LIVLLLVRKGCPVQLIDQTFRNRGFARSRDSSHVGWQKQSNIFTLNSSGERDSIVLPSNTAAFTWSCKTAIENVYEWYGSRDIIFSIITQVNNSIKFLARWLA
jgi:hypothetical protein